MSPPPGRWGYGWWPVIVVVLLVLILLVVTGHLSIG